MNRQIKELFFDILSLSGTILCLILLFSVITNVSARESSEIFPVTAEYQMSPAHNIVSTAEDFAKNNELLFQAVLEGDDIEFGQLDPELRATIEAMEISKEEVLASQQNIIEAVGEVIEDKEQFAEDFIFWKKDMDGYVAPMIGEMGQIINNYAESTKPFDEAYYDLYDELSAFSDKLNAMINRFPLLDKIIKVVEPQVYQAEEKVMKKIAYVPPTKEQRDPMQPVIQFYKAAEKANIFGTGEFFRIDPVTSHYE